MLSHALVTLTPGTLLSTPNGEEGSGTQNLSDPNREDNKSLPQPTFGTQCQGSPLHSVVTIMTGQLPVPQ